MNLHDLGWNDYWEASWKQESRDGCTPARVIAQQKKFWRIAGEFGECWAEPAGKLFRAASKGADLPVVGDWVAVQVRANENRGTIHKLLPRRTKFSRRAAGKRTQEQVLAANADTVFLMSSLNRELNPRRIDRYLASAWESGASPVIVLTKADLCQSVEEAVRTIERSAIGVPVHAVSTVSGEGIHLLHRYLSRRKTVALFGSSGVGKSTLVNYLAGYEVQQIREIRENDDRGRHTTTARELFAMPQGGLILDAPGMRELQLWDSLDGLGETFAEVAAFAEQCRFRDCQHESEPSCAVQAAVATGELDAERLESYHKLEREQQFQLRKMDVNARVAEQKRWKQIHRDQRAMYNRRRSDGLEK